jgi:hypothetical protein
MSDDALRVAVEWLVNSLAAGTSEEEIEAEQAYWFRKKKSMTPEDDAAFREFTRIMCAYLSPASIAEAIGNGRSRPC